MPKIEAFTYPLDISARKDELILIKNVCDSPKQRSNISH
jgi:hypothetical protein